MPHGKHPEEWRGSDMSHKNGYEASKRGIYQGRWIDKNGWESQLWSAPGENAAESSTFQPNEEESVATSIKTIPWGEREQLLSLDEIRDLSAIIGYSPPLLDRQTIIASGLSSSLSVQRFTLTSSVLRASSLQSDDIHMFGNDDEVGSASESSSEPDLTPTVTVGLRTLSLSPSVADHIEIKEEIASSPLSCAKTMSDRDWD
jgi:hypothetical protein